MTDCTHDKPSLRTINAEGKGTVVITFVWRDMTQKERSALNQGVTILHNHPFVIIHPDSYSVDYLLRQYPEIQEMALPDEHFSSIETYNKMMLSPWFYGLWTQYEYMLVYQIDAYVFSDQIDCWTSMGYDYIGAPWMLNDNFYQNHIGHLITRLLKRIPIRDHHVHSAHLYHQVGNGGFSLRRISRMKEIMECNKDLINSVNGKHEKQEDVMISIILREKENLKIPVWRLALLFSFEKAPAKCLKLTQGALPFGCHDTGGHYWESFWKYYIPQSI